MFGTGEEHPSKKTLMPRSIPPLATESLDSKKFWSTALSFTLSRPPTDTWTV